MALNRLIDLPYDRLNPRTAHWPSVTGRVSRSVMMGVIVVGWILLVVSAARLHPVCVRLAPVAVLAMTVYPWMKRWTWSSHLGLGVVLAAAPLGGWLAVRGAIDPPALWWALAVASWVAGFDVLYATQDVVFDRQQRLQSVPARFGVVRARYMAVCSHVVTLGALAQAGTAWQGGAGFWSAWSLVAGLLVFQHVLVWRGRDNQIEPACFAVNSYVGLVLMVGVIVDTWIRGGFS